MLIGPGGKKINEIIAECDNVKIDIEQDGRVVVYHMDREPINKALAIIARLTKEARVGEIYDAKVVKIEEFGCFVQLWPGCEGLVHISQLSHDRVDKVEDVVQLGDEIIV